MTGLPQHLHLTDEHLEFWGRLFVNARLIARMPFKTFLAHDETWRRSFARSAILSRLIRDRLVRAT